MYFYNVVQDWITRDRLMSPCQWGQDNELGLPVFIVHDWLWALSILWSRAFSVQLEGEVLGSLVPVADMFNAFDPHEGQEQVRAAIKGIWL